jgi:RNA polymerase sigma-70 factor, ECF subfamily
MVPSPAGEARTPWGGDDFGWSECGHGEILAFPIMRCNLLGHRLIQFPRDERTRLGVAILEHEPTGRTDPDAVDATLAASGDASAFERLYRNHVPRVYGLVRRMLNDDDADEVAQDIFVRAWQKLGTFRGEAAFGTWLHRLAINVILARRESLGTRRKRYLEGDAALETLPARRPGPEMAMDFEAAMQRLPDGAREVFVLHDVQGYRHEEIAKMLGLATGTSKSQLHRARMALRQHLER